MSEQTQGDDDDHHHHHLEFSPNWLEFVTKNELAHDLSRRGFVMRKAQVEIMSTGQREAVRATLLAASPLVPQYHPCAGPWTSIWNSSFSSELAPLAELSLKIAGRLRVAPH